MKFYREPETKNWDSSGRCWQEGQVGSRVICRPIDLLQSECRHTQGIGLIGFASDTGVLRNYGRSGAVHGPKALRQAAAGLFFTNRTDGLFPISDFGDFYPGEDLESGQEELGQVIEQMLDAKMTPLVLGGGHETAWGHFQGLRSLTKKKSHKLGLINFDAHIDMRPIHDQGQGSSGTPFFQIMQQCKEDQIDFNYLCLGAQPQSYSPILFNIAQSNGVVVVSADDFHMQATAEINRQISDFLSSVDVVYLSICLDVFAAAFCPGVSAPQSRGITHSQFYPFFRQILASDKVISMDIVELCPRFDLDGRTAKYGASLMIDFVQQRMQSKI